MNETQYRVAAGRLLERDSPDIVLEAMLVCGMAPEHDHGVHQGWEDYTSWLLSMEKFLLNRYGYKPDAHLTTVVMSIIERRMDDERVRAIVAQTKASA